MTELEFGERLKQYRKARGLTQQELADLLGVSNKSVSRWESGSYPDVATLGPLAHALGVTVDDLLGVAPPLRSLGRADWQNWLSFAFAIGGGVLFFLLDLFAPTLVCYLLYLGTMAYGVYLQKHYTYHSKWFHRANLAMNFFVNLQLLGTVFSIAVQLTALNTAWQEVLTPTWRDLVALSQDLSALLGSFGTALILLLLWPLCALALTCLTWRFIRNRLDGAPRLGGLRLARAPFAWSKLPPVLGPLLACLFWCLYWSRSLPGWMYVRQLELFYGLLALVVLFTVVWLLAVKRPWMLLPALACDLLCLVYPTVLDYGLSYSTLSGSFFPEGRLNQIYYLPFGQPTGALFILGVALMAAYLLCCFVRLTLKKPAPGGTA